VALQEVTGDSFDVAMWAVHDGFDDVEDKIGKLIVSFKILGDVVENTS
jgi:hypothetical protein